MFDYLINDPIYVLVITVLLGYKLLFLFAKTISILNTNTYLLCK